MIPTARFLQLRDGISLPETEEEMLELVRFNFRCEYAAIEQAQAQRRPASFDQVREMEIAACRKIIRIYEDFRERHPASSHDETQGQVPEAGNEQRHG